MSEELYAIYSVSGGDFGMGVLVCVIYDKQLISRAVEAVYETYYNEKDISVVVKRFWEGEDIPCRLPCKADKEGE